MASGTLTVTETETVIQVIGFEPGAVASFEIHYHYEPDAARYFGLNGYIPTNDAGEVNLTIPLGSDFVKTVTGESFTFADGPFFTGNGVFLATRP